MDPKLLSGTVELLILEIIARGPTYGYQIAQAVMAESGGTFELKEGSLYPALHRLERQEWLSAYWVDSDAGRRRKYYRITAAGAGALEAKRAEWERFTSGVRGVLGDRTSRALA